MNKRNGNKNGYMETKVGWIPEDWDCVQIGDIAKVSSGGTPSRKNRKYWGKEIPWVKTAQINNSYIYESNIDEWITRLGLEKSSARMISAETILMAMYGQGKTRGQVAILKREAAINQACAAIFLNKDVNKNFIFQQLLYRYHTIRNLSNDGSQKNLNASLIRSISIPLPTLDQQNYIAAILSVWDRAIEQISKLINAKTKLTKALMQQLLSGKRRFKEFGQPAQKKGELPEGWHEMRVNKLFQRVIRKNKAGVNHVLTASGQHGLVDQRDYFNRSVASQSLEDYYHIKRGEYAYNRSAMKGYPYGAIKRLDKYSDGVLSTLYLCFALSSQKNCSDFFMHYFEAGFLNRQLRGIVHVGARAHGLLNVTADDFFALKTPVPSITEQKQIASVINCCDRKIKLLRKERMAILNQKKGLMQKLLTGQIRVIA